MFDTLRKRMCYANIPLVGGKSILNFPAVTGGSPEQSAKLREAYATECLILCCHLEGPATSLEWQSRLVIGTAIPREAGGTAAVRKGNEARMKAREKCISSRALKRLTEAR
jgi:hypothetical protein